MADALAIALCHYFASAAAIMGGPRSATFTGVNTKALLGDDPTRTTSMTKTTGRRTIRMITKMTGS